MLPAAIAVYELADGESAVVAAEPLLSVVEEAAWSATVRALRSPHVRGNGAALLSIAGTR